VLVLVQQQEMDMLFFRIDQDGNVVEVLTEKDEDRHGKDVIYRGDLKDFAHATRIAQQATEVLGRLCLPCDKGEWVHPRYDVVEAPRVGTPVSYSFNGDSYPDGHIVRVGGTDCSRVYTDTGSVYNRRRKSASWIKRGGTWSLIQGHVSERNPSF
jgi:hypothetical protein